MTEKQITVPSEFTESLLAMIENRIREIGKNYQANGRSYHDDLEITGLRAMARQLGFDYQVSSVTAGFEVSRYEYTPVE